VNNGTDLVVLPMVTRRFAVELISLCEDQKQFATQDTQFWRDLIAFIDGVKKNAT
jgi:hypothetical protein